MIKRILLQTVRRLGLQKPADQAMYLKNLLQFHARNRAFSRAHPDFPVPPSDLAYDAYHHVDRQAYRLTGERHARVFAEIIEHHLPPGPIEILEWGCGPGRIIRHMRQALAGRAVELTGVDLNGRSIAWCQRSLPDIAFLTNEMLPPTRFADERFDVVYNFSVFTHLSADVQKSWARELWRILKPGGLFISTTHGDYYRDHLGGANETAQYQNGEPVVMKNYDEGKKWYLALHPPRYVRDELLRDFADVRMIPQGPEALMRQDVWVARKPASADTDMVRESRA
jgi:SAM-dependent methyltransferase